MFFGFLAAKATIEQGGIKLYTNTEQETEYISRSVLELFNRELSYKKRVKGVRGYELFFFCDSALEHLKKLTRGNFFINSSVLPANLHFCGEFSYPSVDLQTQIKHFI